MENIATVLKWVFTYVFYPGLILGIFLFIIGTVISLYHRTDSFRVILAATLPIILLVFIVINDANEQILKTFIDTENTWIHFLVGAFFGISIIEIGNRASRSLEPIFVALYSLYLSLIGVFILYSIMTTAIQSIHTMLFVLVIVGGLHAIFRGIPGMSDSLE
jgi:CDP-diglyceride synthetase